MPRPLKVIRPVAKKICFPEDLVAKIDLTLFSELEGKVPFGAWQEFLVGLVRKHFERQARAQALLTELRGAATRDTETAHGIADRLLCETLLAEGYGEAVAYFESMEKWYA